AVVCLLVGATAAGAVVFFVLRPRPADVDESAAATAELARAQSEAATRLEAMIGLVAKGQTQLQSAMAERLDAVSHRMNQSMATTTQQTVERLQGLHERLAVIDRAQK